MRFARIPVFREIVAAEILVRGILANPTTSFIFAAMMDLSPFSAPVGKHQIVLLGVGHTNAHVVRMWRMKRIPNAELTCVSDRSIATYSGMLPATLAGQIPEEQMQIDLVRLCASVGARLIVDRVTGVDHENAKLFFADRPPVPFDVLSVGIGSQPTVASLVEPDSPHLLKIKPMQTFMARLRERIAALKGGGDLKVAVVGSGVAGLEIAFCLKPFLAEHGLGHATVVLVTRSKQIFQEGQSNTRKLLERELARKGMQLICGKSVTAATSSGLRFEDGNEQPADLVVWATGASAPNGLQELGFECTTAGFLQTDHTLQVTGRDDAPGTVFAVGDTGTIAGENLPKAGVYAVRQGPVLWENIQRALEGRTLQRYRPQKSFLSLINLGDGQAIAQWKGRAFCGKWAYRLKHSIDSKFMEKFEPISMADEGGEAMQCQGCGCKFDATSLSEAMASVSGTSHITLDDAAPIGERGGNVEGAERKLYASTDFFTNPLDDAYLFGSITALHSSSDLIATGIGPSEALSNVVLPEGHARTQQQMLAEFLEGANQEFRALGASIVGGHTIVGPRFEAGFTVVGSPWGDQPLTKGGLQPGDTLYMTKPLGIGVLLAAHMRSKCPAAAYEELLHHMLAPQQEYARVATELGVLAATDITGFGLIGHLVEMLEASDCAAQLDFASIPILQSAVQLSSAGISSSLLPDNMRLSLQVQTADKIKSDGRYPLLFDPQTCGGLLFGVPTSIESQFLHRIREAGLGAPAAIGQVDYEAANAGLIALM